jgi:autotransporter-associated beta strand protein
MHLPRPLLALAFSATLLATIAQAQVTSTWIGGTDSNWNTAANWSPATVPSRNGTASSAGYTAIFNAGSGAASVSLDGTNVFLGRLEFTSDALATTLTNNTFTGLTGDGIVNASAATQTIVNYGYFSFLNAATAGSITFENHNNLAFYNTASAGNATIQNAGASIEFRNTSTAGNAVLTNNGNVDWTDSSTAGSATLVNADGATMTFSGSSSAGTATLQNDSSLAINSLTALNQAAVTNGSFGQIGYYSSGNIGIGSLAGTGEIQLTGSNLTIGGLNTSTTFAGNINAFGDGTTLTKIGTGTLTLTGGSDYSGATTVSAGTLLVNGTSGSSLGNGNDVIVESGATLGGTGLIGNNDVKIFAGGHLAPGNNGVGTLSINSNLLLYDGAVLDFQLGPVNASDRINTGLLGGTLYDWETPGGITLNFTDAGGFGAGTYILFDFTGGYTSLDPANISFGSVIAGYDYSLAYNGDYLELTATLAAIPEPSTYAAIFGALALGLIVFRRRQLI